AKVESYVKNIDSSRSLLQNERASALKALNKKVTAANIGRLVDLGLWNKAQNYFTQADTSSNAIQLVQAQLFMKKNQFFKAESKVEAVLADKPNNTAAKILRAKLYIQSWELDKADK